MGFQGGLKIAQITGKKITKPSRQKVALDVSFGKRGLLEKGSFEKSSCSRDSREFRDSRDSRQPPNCGKQESDHFLEILDDLEILEVKTRN